MQAAQIFIGVDVSKDDLVVAGHDTADVVPGSVANTRTAIRTWLKRLPPGSVIAMESTGGYEQLLARMAYEHRFEVYILNPANIHLYGRSMGNRGKTDRLDSEVIARYVAKEYVKLHHYEPVPKELVDLQQLRGQRSIIVRACTALRLSSDRRRNIKSPLEAKALAALNAWAQDLEKQLLAGIKKNPELRQQFELLTSIKGIGVQSGAALSVLFERVKFTSSDAVVAYCGLDPRPRDSGRKRGVRRLSKQGDKGLRALLYTAASSACRTAAFHSYYQSLRDRGLKGTEALVILARKLLRIAYGVCRTKTPFDPTRLQLTAT